MKFQKMTTSKMHKRIQMTRSEYELLHNSLDKQVVILLYTHFVVDFAQNIYINK